MAEQHRRSAAHWEHYAHGADIGLRGVGASLAESFEQAALALTGAIAEPSSVMPNEVIDLHCEAPDHELLLAEWLNTLIYEMATRNMLFCRFEVSIDGENLNARAWGEKVDAARHRPAVEVKGATYTTLRVAQDDDQWIAQTVVDV